MARLLSVPRWEDALQGDDDVDHEEQLTVLVWLAAARVGDGPRLQRREVGDAGAVGEGRNPREKIVVRRPDGRVRRLRLRQVRVRGHFALADGVEFFPSVLSHVAKRPDMDG